MYTQLSLAVNPKQKYNRIFAQWHYTHTILLITKVNKFKPDTHTL